MSPYPGMIWEPFPCESTLFYRSYVGWLGSFPYHTFFLGVFWIHSLFTFTKLSSVNSELSDEDAYEESSWPRFLLLRRVTVLMQPLCCCSYTAQIRLALFNSTWSNFSCCLRIIMSSSLWCSNCVSSRFNSWILFSISVPLYFGLSLSLYLY